MPVKHSVKNLLSVESRKKIGLPNGCGRAICGWSLCGDWNDRSAIYRVRHYEGQKHKERLEFYPYIITNTTEQATRRATFADAVLAWQNLAENQKSEFNRKAIGRHMSGYNLFIRYYLLSH